MTRRPAAFDHSRSSRFLIRGSQITVSSWNHVSDPARPTSINSSAAADYCFAGLWSSSSVHHRVIRRRGCQKHQIRVFVKAPLVIELIGTSESGDLAVAATSISEIKSIRLALVLRLPAGAEYASFALIEDPFYQFPLEY